MYLSKENRSKFLVSDVAIHYKMDLIPQGSGYVAVCPFHPDVNPSLYLDIYRNRWHCMGCHAGGDGWMLAVYYERLTHVSVDDVVLARRLASELSIPLDLALEQDIREPPKERRPLPRQLLSANKPRRKGHDYASYLAYLVSIQRGETETLTLEQILGGDYDDFIRGL